MGKNNISKYDIRRLTNPERIQLTIYDMEVKKDSVLLNEKIKDEYVSKISCNNDDGNIQIIVYLNDQYQYSFSKTSSKGVIQIYQSGISNTSYDNDDKYEFTMNLNKKITEDDIKYNHDRETNTFTLKIPTKYGSFGKGGLKVGDKVSFEVEKVEGKVSELAAKFDMTDEMFVAFIDGLNASLETEFELQSNCLEMKEIY